MGVLNITPDSFSDGGKFIKKVSAIKQIDKLIFDGYIKWPLPCLGTKKNFFIIKIRF